MIEVLKIMKKPANSDIFIVSGSEIQIKRILNYSGCGLKNVLYLNFTHRMKVDVVFIHLNNEQSKVSGHEVNEELKRLKLAYFKRVLHYNGQMLQFFLNNAKLVAELHKEKLKNPFAYLKFTERVGTYFIRNKKTFSFAVFCSNEKIVDFNTNFNMLQTEKEELMRLSIMESYKRDKYIREYLFNS